MGTDLIPSGIHTLDLEFHEGGNYLQKSPPCWHEGPSVRLEGRPPVRAHCNARVNDIQRTLRRCQLTIDHILYAMERNVGSPQTRQIGVLKWRPCMVRDMRLTTDWREHTAFASPCTTLHAPMASGGPPSHVIKHNELATSDSSSAEHESEKL